MFKIFGWTVPKYTVRISPHTKKLQIVRVLRLNCVPKKDDEDCSDYYDMKQFGDVGEDE